MAYAREDQAGPVLSCLKHDVRRSPPRYAQQPLVLKLRHPSMEITRLRAYFAACIFLSCASGYATTIWTKQDQAAYEECLARWKEVDGAWEGLLSTPGAEAGSRYSKTVFIRLVFTREGTTLLVKNAPGQSWHRIGSDSNVPRVKTDLLVQVMGDSQNRLEGHSVTFTRMSETVASVIYSRGPIHANPGEVISMHDLRTGVVAREGFPVPTGLEAMQTSRRNCR